MSTNQPLAQLLREFHHSASSILQIHDRLARVQNDLVVMMQTTGEKAPDDLVALIRQLEGDQREEWAALRTCEAAIRHAATPFSTAIAADVLKIINELAVVVSNNDEVKARALLGKLDATIPQV